MACMKIGSKPEAFHLQGQSWHCVSDLPSDITIEIGEMTFHLHKSNLLSRSELLKKLIEELKSDGGSECVLKLGDIPGGAKAFELIAKFCYEVRIEITALNVVSLRCAAEYLQMVEENGDGSLIASTETFLDEVFGSWRDTIKALESCEEVFPQAEDLHIVSRCINSLAMKASADPQLLNILVSEGNSNEPNGLWNGIRTTGNQIHLGDDWWYEDVTFLSLPLYKRFIQAVDAAGAEPESVAGSLVYYAKKYIPSMNRQPSFKDASNVKPDSDVSTPSEADQRALLEEIVELIPCQKGITETRFLMRMLRTAMILQTSPSCRENFEKRVGFQLDQVALEDLLIPTMGYSVETLYDIDCFQRILDHFIEMEQPSNGASPCIMDESQLIDSTRSLTSMTIVANLVDAYLAEVASDANMKLPKFQTVAASLPDYARPLSDGLYRAIDIYLKAHPWLTDKEREQICRLMNCQKLSVEASSHAAQNDRLPLRVIIQVLFFEQLRLRTTISGWFYVSGNFENPADPDGSVSMYGNGARARGSGGKDMRGQVSELDIDCHGLKEEFHKKVKSKRIWNIFCGRKYKSFNCNRQSKPCQMKTQMPHPSNNGHKSHDDFHHLQDYR